MNRITTKPEATHPVAPTEVVPVTTLPTEERGLGWNIALVVWVVSFVVLVLYEAWNFVFPLVRGLFR